MNEDSAFPEEDICITDYLDFLTQAVSSCQLLDTPVSFLRLILSGYSLQFLFLYCRKDTVP